MSYLAASVGLILVVLITLDTLWTTLTLDGAGLVSMRVTRWVSRLMFFARRHPTGRVLQGPIVLFLQTATWVLVSWCGWMLLFSSFEGAVLSAEHETPANFWSRAYYVGFVMVTLGNGDFMPGGHVWQFFSVGAATHGFIVITLAVSYYVTVLDGVHNTRVFAQQVDDLGPNARACVQAAYDGRSLALLMDALSTIGERGVQVERQIRAHPVVLAFHTRTPASLPRATALLDDVVLLLEYAVPGPVRPRPFQIRPIRRCLDRMVHHIAALQKLRGERMLAPPAVVGREPPLQPVAWALDTGEHERRVELHAWLKSADELDEYEDMRAASGDRGGDV